MLWTEKAAICPRRNNAWFESELRVRSFLAREIHRELGFWSKDHVKSYHMKVRESTVWVGKLEFGDTKPNGNTKDEWGWSWKGWVTVTKSSWLFSFGISLMAFTVGNNEGGMIRYAYRGRDLRETKPSVGDNLKGLDNRSEEGHWETWTIMRCRDRKMFDCWMEEAWEMITIAAYRLIWTVRHP